MDFNKIYSSLSEKFPELDIRRDEDMRLHTSFRIGGPARIFVEAESEKQLAALICALNELGAKYLVIGRGTNLLVKDEGFEGVVIHMGEGIAHIDAGNRSINAEAGASLAAIASAALQHGLTGMEFAHGIPGSLGGALLMNAGAYGGEMADIVDFVRYLDAEGNIREADAADCRFGYRHSRFEDEPCVILGARLRLGPGSKEAIAARMKELSEKRIASQPLDKPSAGSTFKRPATGYAAAMIDQCGLKGYRVGGAEVSTKHAGFVVNIDNASCADVLAVMEGVQKEVYDRFGVMLEPEVRIV
ncbi:MAG: UDP-N-acetylmuramate dehydrogenase [Oscillospiraceae bacterium]|nr:UDP-N-acetylmuramate dehydrogenase [Oscillospiraceae bacterium]